MTDTLCPTEGRRELAELIWSFTVTLITALTLYSHLQHSLLRTNRLAIAILTYAFFPFLEIYRLIHDTLATCILTSLDYNIHIVRETRTEMKKSSEDKRYCLSALLGTRIRGIGQQDRGALLIDYHPGNNWLGDRYIQTRKRELSVCVILGQVVLGLFATLQCVGSVIKGVRRFNHGPDSVTLMDAYIFWYALSGIVILGESLGSIILNEEWEPQPTDTGDVIDPGTCHPNVLTISRFLVILSMVLIFPPFSLKEKILECEELWTLIDPYVTTYIVAGFLVLALETATDIFGIFGLLEPFVENQPWRQLALKVWERLIIVVFWSLFISSALFVICAFILDLSTAFETHGDSWPTSIPCPQLWKDPIFLPAI